MLDIPAQGIDNQRGKRPVFVLGYAERPLTQARREANRHRFEFFLARDSAHSHHPMSQSRDLSTVGVYSAPQRCYSRDMKNSTMEYGDAVAVIVNDMGAEIDRLRAALEAIVQIYET